jgi:hypothetical protein
LNNSIAHLEDHSGALFPYVSQNEKKLFHAYFRFYFYDCRPVGSRASALGNSTASLSDTWSAAQNQAGLGLVRVPGAGVFYENRFLIKELSIRSAVLAMPVKVGTMGLALTDFGYSLYKENKYSLSFGKAFSKNFSVGMALDYLSTRIAEGNGNFATVVGEIGMQAKPNKNLVIGAHLYNPTRSQLDKHSTERAPAVLQLGIGYSFSSQVFLTAETEKDIAKNAIFKVGIEYQPINNFYLRIGISTEPVLTAFGFGVHLKSFQVDIAAAYHQTLGITSKLGLSYLFNKSDKTVRSNN